MPPLEKARIERARAEAVNRTEAALTLIAEKGTVADRAWALALASWIYESVGRAEDSLTVGLGAKAPDDQSRSQAIGVWSRVNLVKSTELEDDRRAAAAFSEARNSATRISDPWSRSWALVNVARGQVSLARQQVQRHGEDKVDVKVKTAGGKTAMEALAEAEMIHDPRDRARSLAAVRWIIERDGLLPGALNDPAIGGARDQSRALTIVAWVLAKAGWTVEANRAANGASLNAYNIVNDEERSQSLSALASVQAYLHNFQLARETADRCARSVDKLQAYTAMLREYARRQNPDISVLLEAEEIETDSFSIHTPVNSFLWWTSSTFISLEGSVTKIILERRRLRAVLPQVAI